MKRYKIVNRFKFIRFLLIVLFFLALVFAITVNASGFKERQIKKEEEFLSNYEEVEIIVSGGDTSWTIQKSLAPNSDPRKLIYYAGEINNKNMGYINEGEILIFLKERD